MYIFQSPCQSQDMHRQTHMQMETYSVRTMASQRRGPEALGTSAVRTDRVRFAEIFPERAV